MFNLCLKSKPVKPLFHLSKARNSPCVIIFTEEA